MRIVYHKTRYKDGKPVTDPKEKGGEEVHERFTLSPIDANDAVTRFPKHYSYDEPAQGAKIVNRVAPMPGQGLVEVDEGTTPPPGLVAVSHEAPNDAARTELAGHSFLDPNDREPLVGGKKK